MAREFLAIAEETSYGAVTLVNSAINPNTSMYVRLDEGNSFTMRQRPQRVNIMFGGGFAYNGYPVQDFHAVEGELRVKLCYSQASRFMKWAITRVNSGRTTPWTTTDASGVMPPEDLASVSIYHAYVRNDGTFKRRAYRGTKVKTWRLEVNRQSQVATLSLGLQAKQADGGSAALTNTSDPTNTEFPAPAVTVFPTDAILFSHSSGGLTITNTVRTQYESISLNGNNALDPKWYESKFLQTCRFLGGSTTLEARMRLKATPDDRTAYELSNTHIAKTIFTNGVNTLTLDYNGQNYTEDMADDYALEKEYEYTLRLANYYDTVVGGDQGHISVTYA